MDLEHRLDDTDQARADLRTRTDELAAARARIDELNDRIRAPA